MALHWAKSPPLLAVLAACGGPPRDAGECKRSYDNECGRACLCPAGTACEAATSEPRALHACVAPCERDEDCPSGQLCSAGADAPEGRCWPACGLAADCPTWGECRTQRALPAGADVSVCRLRSD